MNMTTKKIFYLIMMTGIVSADCCAGDEPKIIYGPQLPSGNNQATVYQPGGYGQYATSNINSSDFLQPIYIALDTYQPDTYQTYLLKQQQEEKDADFALESLIEDKKKQDAIDKQIKEDKELGESLLRAQPQPQKEKKAQLELQPQLLQQSKQLQNVTIGISTPLAKTQTMPVLVQNNTLAKYDNSRGGVQDISAIYNNSKYASQSFFKTISTQLSRTANNSSLFIFRCGNTYQDIYQEDNTNSTLIDIALFNTYKKGMIVNNTNSSRFKISIGDLVLGEYRQPNDNNSTNWPLLSIDRNQCAALLAVGIALKYGILQTCLHAAGIGMPYMVAAVPLMVGGAFMLPIVVAIGTSLVVIVGGLVVCAGGVAIAGGMILLPLSPLLMLLWAASRR